ncbi:MAG TPA: 50S ribosomal protein L2, partial [Woeseiaceae bacterium]|nr:50S ribosomal protein L2 [Woeseiaceae bacterium]
MSLHKARPTSAGRRFSIAVKTPGLHKGKPEGALIAKKSRTGGRNNSGRITVRHQGGGHKQRYRLVDFKRDKEGVPGVVERLEYDPNRSAHLALIKYADGERRYILAPKGVQVGSPVVSGDDAPIKPGNALRLNNIPVGTTVHCVEMKPGKGAQLVRSAGAAAQIAAREGAYVTVRLRSGESRRLHIDCRATVGEVGHGEHNLRKLGKAG